MRNILILNGPNLNLLGTRQPEFYGRVTLEEIAQTCRAKARELGIKIDFRQSNHEGVLIDWIQETKDTFDGLILNAGGYTHSSIALHDAIASVGIPTIELHLSNIKEREAFRHISYIEPVAFQSIMGHGADGYPIALEAMVAHLA
ncbi:MAG: type II 3-dehydroquinate dehydratase [Pseudomonadota bacterium]